MPPFDDLTSALPARRDDEPPLLRGEIAKELRDHLQCAVQRELVLTGNEEEATRRALVKFGDPARIARQLWFDALWEQIMSQRILVGLCAAMTVACLSMGVFNWRTAADSTEVVRKLIEQSDAANRLLIEQSREGNHALLESMGRLAAAGESRRTPDWVSVKIRLVLDTDDGPPAMGFTVRVHEVPLDRPSDSHVEINEKSSREGIVDCGYLRARVYGLKIVTPWNEAREDTFYVRAGVAEQIQTIVCPSTELLSAEVTFELDVPDDLRGAPLGVLCQFGHSVRLLDGQPWVSDTRDSQMTFIVSPEGRIWKTSVVVDDVYNSSPRSVRIQNPERIDPLRWPIGKHWVRAKGLVVLGDRRDPWDGRQVPWFPTVGNDHVANSELTVEPSGTNKLRIPVPERLHSLFRDPSKVEPKAQSSLEGNQTN